MITYILRFMNKNSKTKDSSENKIKDLRNENLLLKSQLMTNSLINELTKVMHTTTNPDNVIQTLLLGIHEIVGFNRIILFEINKDDFTLKPKAWYGVDESQCKDISIPLGFEGGEITDAIFLKRHLIVEEVYPEEDFFYKQFNSRSYIVIPFVGRIITKHLITGKLSTKSSETDETISENERRKNIIASKDFKTQGVIWLDRTTNKSPITSEDISTLSSILNQTAIILENILMFNALEIANTNLHVANKKLTIVNKKLRDANAKINRDLKHAKTIQQGLLPQQMPDTPALSIKPTYIPAEAVSGDYYDVFEINPGIFGIIIADVSGHGVSSALIMTMVKVLLKTFVHSSDGPQKTLEKINDIFMTEINTDHFVTVFYAILNTNKHQINYTSAGHCPIFFLDKKSKICTKVKADGLFLGVFPDMMLKEQKDSYTPGTFRVLLYTDGLTEARNRKGEMYDLDRLEEISLATLKYSPEQASKKILTAQKKFCGKNTVAGDDITMLVIDF